MQDSFGRSTVSTYDANGDLLKRQLIAPGQTSISVTLDYTANGEVNTLTRSSGGSTVGSTQYSYDESGNVTGIAHLDASGNVLDGFVYAYDAANQVTSESDFGNQENSVGPIAGVSSPDVLDAAILASMKPGSSTLGGSSSTTTVQDSTTGGSSLSFTGLTSPTNYTYDAAGQLIAAGSQNYQYDANGNRINAGYVIGRDNQLLSDGTWDYTYDPDGNEIGKLNIATGVSWAYAYDDANQMTSATEYAAGGKTILAQVTYTYDVFGNRLQQTTYAASTGTTTVQRYGYDGQNVWADLDGSNHLQTRYLYGDAVDEILARVGSTGVVAWYLTDHLGSVRDLMLNSGAITDHRNYDAFGNIVYETNAGGGDRYGFTGRELDTTTGLQYNRARYYDASMGRWTSQDPLGFGAGDTNLYRFVVNNPSNDADPSGLLDDSYPWYKIGAGSNCEIVIFGFVVSGESAANYGKGVYKTGTAELKGAVGAVTEFGLTANDGLMLYMQSVSNSAGTPSPFPITYRSQLVTGMLEVDDKTRGGPKARDAAVRAYTRNAVADGMSLGIKPLVEAAAESWKTNDPIPVATAAGAIGGGLLLSKAASTVFSKERAAPNTNAPAATQTRRVFTTTSDPVDLGRPGTGATGPGGSPTARGAGGTFDTEADLTDPATLARHIDHNVPPGRTPRYVSEVEAPASGVKIDPTEARPIPGNGWIAPNTPGARVSRMWEIQWV